MDLESWFCGKERNEYLDICSAFYFSSLFGIMENYPEEKSCLC